MKRKKPSQNITKNSFEKSAWEEKSLICGIDEVGRGCLGGPLVSAAVILPGRTSPRLKDSKILTETERLKAYRWIIRHCWYGFGFTHNRMIDTVNIWQATLIAMKKALLHATSQCPYLLSAVVTDAMPLKLLDTGFKNIPVHFFYQGEQKSSSIAAASIIAKVKRDDMMQHYNRIFPGYQLDQHKGYSTKNHKDAIKQNGYTLIHRMSFISKTVPPECFSGARIGEKLAREQAYDVQGETNAHAPTNQQLLI